MILKLDLPYLMHVTFFNHAVLFSNFQVDFSAMLLLPGQVTFDFEMSLMGESQDYVLSGSNIY